MLANFTIFFVISKKSFDSKLMFAKGSLLCSSKPAEINITSGLNLSIGFKILLSSIFIKFFPFVPDLIDNQFVSR